MKLYFYDFKLSSIYFADLYFINMLRLNKLSFIIVCFDLMDFIINNSKFGNS